MKQIISLFIGSKAADLALYLVRKNIATPCVAYTISLFVLFVGLFIESIIFSH